MKYSFTTAIRLAKLKLLSSRQMALTFKKSVFNEIVHNVIAGQNPHFRDTMILGNVSGRFFATSAECGRSSRATPTCTGQKKKHFDKAATRPNSLPPQQQKGAVMSRSHWRLNRVHEAVTNVAAQRFDSALLRAPNDENEPIRSSSQLQFERQRKCSTRERVHVGDARCPEHVP